MFSKIVVGHDKTERGGDALALGRLLASATGADLIVAHVLPNGFPADLDWEDSQRSERDSVEKELAALASSGTVTGKTEVAVITSSPAHGLYDLAEAHQADLIVVGSSHRGALGRVLMGSVTERLLHGAPCAVAVAPRGYGHQKGASLGVIGVAFDGSRESEAACAVAMQIAEAMGASVRLLAVQFFGDEGVPSWEYDREARDQAERERLGHAIVSTLKQMPPGVLADGEVLEGEIAETLASRAEEGIDLLITGSRGYGPMRRALLGSVSTELARSAPCPLLVVAKAAGASD